jgi:LPS-assembly protein
MVLVVTLGLLPASVLAAGFEQCGPGFVIPPSPDIESPSNQPDFTDFESDDADLRDSGESILRGNVVIHRNTMRLSADEVRYHSENETVDAIGRLRVWDQGAYITGTRGKMVLPQDVTIIEDAEYRVLDAHAHGVAKFAILSGSDILKASDATYSTCTPGQEDWFLEADNVYLDKGRDQGTARNVWITFKNTPIFYTPYLSFPLSDARKSGFLAPGAGVSSSSGFEATVPYYFNIAPNLDATVATRAMSERGVQLQGEFRYLFPWGQGTLAGEILPHDSEREEARGGVSFAHLGNFAPYWHTDLRFDWVSDGEYFEDLGSSLAVTSHSYLEQRADAYYYNEWLYLLTRAQSFQTLDGSLPGTSRPYKRLPQIYASTHFRERNLRPTFNTTSELVHFDRRDSVTGVRWDLRPHVTVPYRTAAGFVVPKLAVRYTGYALDGRAPGLNESPSRVVPTFSLDSGLFFERRLNFASRSLLQTLEPRAYYLFTPFNQQNDLPVFDTGEYTFSFGQLFREDRFSGADRVGDAHQVTLALTTRFLDEATGAEFLRASIGQIQYFRSRRVTLPGALRETSRDSDLVAEVAANLDERWRVSAGVQWDTGEKRTDRNTVAVRYQPDSRRVVNAAYRFVRDRVEQTDVSIAWPVSRYWRAVGRWNYSIDAKATLETFAGFEYESCCWGLRLVARRYLSTLQGEYNSGVFVQLVLKGLSDFGGAGEFLSRSIPGYRDEF